MTAENIEHSNNKSTRLRDNLVHYSIYLVIGFILLSTLLSFWNRYVTYDTRRIITQTEQIRDLLLAIEHDVLDQSTLALQANALSRREEAQRLFSQAIRQKNSIFSSLQSSLAEQKYPPQGLQNLKKIIDIHFDVVQVELNNSTQTDSVKMANVNSIFSDNATKASYRSYFNAVEVFENEIRENAQSDYEWSIADNAIIQIILVILSLPILLICSSRLRKEVMQRNALLKELSDNNELYLYNDGNNAIADGHGVIGKTIASLKLGFTFIENVAKGNYKQAQSLVPKEVEPLNETTLMGALLRMSTKLEGVEKEDKNRQWASDGLNEFYGIVRNYQDNAEALAERATWFLTKYLLSQQGSLFVLARKDEEPFLEMVACYAFDKKKWIKKRIEVGDGMVGQVYLEGEVAMFTDIPNGYTHITSGLGHATPTCLIIVPLKYNEKTEAVIELASFRRFELYEIDFLKKAGEFLAAALQNAKNKHEMETLLRQSQEQAEILRAQEEELRQNMEELEATNEALSRRERELRE